MKQTIEEFYALQPERNSSNKAVNSGDANRKSKGYMPPVYEHECYPNTRFFQDTSKNEDLLTASTKNRKDLLLANIRSEFEDGDKQRRDDEETVLGSVSNSASPEHNNEHRNKERKYSVTSDDNDDDDGDNYESVNQSPDNISDVNSEETTETPHFQALYEEDLLDKLENTQVLEQFKVLNTISEIDISNLNKLQQVNRSDPSIKRLLTRNRLTSKEVKDVVVDEDIKNVVNEFLQTNSTGNLLIARVLRENQCTFYSWLSAHLQLERNAWAARLKQALDMMNQHRSQGLLMKSTMTESTQQLHHLIHNCVTEMVGTASKDHGDVCCHSSCTLQTSTDMYHVSGDSLKNCKDTIVSSYAPTNKNSDYTRKQNVLESHPHVETCHDFRKGHLLPNFHCNLIGPGMSSNVDSCSVLCSDSVSYANTAARRSIPELKTSGVTSVLPKNELLQLGHPVNSYNDSRYSMNSHNDIRHPINPYNESCTADGDTDLRQVMCDVTDKLKQIYQWLINDRNECFRTLGIQPCCCSSLTEAVTKHTQEKQHSSHDNRAEIEKKLSVLESENRSLHSEIASLQKSLTDKAKDVIHLQNQLDRIEALLHSRFCAGNDVEQITAINGTWTKSLYESQKPRNGFVGKTKSNNSSRGDKKSQNCDPGVYPVKTQRKQSEQDYRVSLDKTIQENVQGIISNIRSFSNDASAISGEKPIKSNKERLDALKSRAGKLGKTVSDIVARMEKQNKLDPSDKCVSSGGFMAVPKPPSALNKTWKHGLKFSNTRLWQNTASYSNNPDQLSCSVPFLEHSDNILREGNKLGVDMLAVDKNPRVMSPLRENPSASESAPILSSRTPKLSNFLDTVATMKSIAAVNSEDQTCTKDTHIKRHSDTDNVMDKNKELSDKNRTTAKRYLRTNVVSLEAAPTRPLVSRFPQHGSMVTKCLRCQKSSNNIPDNHSLACSYHAKSLLPIE